MRVVLLGATKGMGRSLARLMAARGDALFLLGRDLEDLARSARDLEVRGAKGPCGTALCDLAEPRGFGESLDAARAALGGLDCVVVTAGVFWTQEELEEQRALALKLTTLDFAHTVVFCEEARTRLLESGGGVLCVFSSVAGDRGRSGVVIYGAAKAGLSAYLEGLDHRYRTKGLRTVCVKPGFVRTSMTEGLPPPPFAGDPEDVARVVLRAIDRGTPVVYAPPIWRLVMALVRRLPRTLMRRVKF
jgi:decaprenylphospho-beta-D-erythro-pentofuranosid-2-ulose 2-reductase